MQKTDPILEVSQLEKKYVNGNVTTQVLRGVSFTVEKGQCLAVVGESGSGKSTLLHIIGTLDCPSSGMVRIAGLDPFAGGDKEVSAFRNLHMGFVFQQYNLLPEFNALENVMLPGRIAGRKREELRTQARQLLLDVGMGERLHHYPSQLSGGEQQRVAIARALINSPFLVLADEPSGSLDSENATRIHNLFSEINKKTGCTFVIVTHNKNFAQSLPRRIELCDGKVLA